MACAVKPYNSAWVFFNYNNNPTFDGSRMTEGQSRIYRTAGLLFKNELKTIQSLSSEDLTPLRGRIEEINAAFDRLYFTSLKGNQGKPAFAPDLTVQDPNEFEKFILFLESCCLAKNTALLTFAPADDIECLPREFSYLHLTPDFPGTHTEDFFTLALVEKMRDLSETTIDPIARYEKTEGLVINTCDQSLLSINREDSLSAPSYTAIVNIMKAGKLVMKAMDVMRKARITITQELCKELEGYCRHQIQLHQITDHFPSTSFFDPEEKDQPRDEEALCQKFIATHSQAGAKLVEWLQNEENRRNVGCYVCQCTIPGICLLPDEIATSSYLKELRIVSSNHVPLSLPANIALAPNLHTLKLHGPNLEAILPEVVKLVNLQRLVLSGNVIRYFPKGIREVNEGNLRIIAGEPTPFFIGKSEILSRDLPECFFDKES
jgi:Leucine-rich repeat (LRR) protein